jgi:hypothetical protein
VPPPESPGGSADAGRPAGILTVDDPRCVELARRLATAIAEDSEGFDAAPCGRPAGLPRGVTALPASAFQPPRPFSGPLFAAIESAAIAARLSGAAGCPHCLALVVPLVRLGDDGCAPADPAAAIADHVNLALRGPLAGPWPAGRPRTFPSMNGVYVPGVAEELLVKTGGGESPAAISPAAHPAPPTSTTVAGEREPEDGRSAAGPAVYSRLAVAGVADTGRPTVFEVDQARAAGLSWASSCLIAPVVIAAYYGLAVAAVGVPGGR